MAKTRPTYQLVDALVDAMTSGRVPTRPTFICAICCGPARAPASPRGDVLSVSILCPCSAMEQDHVPQWPGWEALLSPPPPDFVADPLGLTGRSRPRVGIAFDAQRWREAVPCPYCGAPLATDKTMQCFVCRTDWNDSQNVVRRPNPARERLGLAWRATYSAELCHGSDRRRYVRYRQAEGGTPDPHRVFETPMHPGWRCVAWGQHGFAGQVATTTGDEFMFDAGGVWLTWDEVRGLHRHLRDEVAWAGIRWATGVPPLFPAK
jgi:hypothetical protein